MSLRTMRCSLLPTSLAAFLCACSPFPDDAGLGPSGGKADDLCGSEDPVALVPDFGGRAFQFAVAAQEHPAATDVWYIAERRGILWRMERAEGVTTPRRFGDLRSLVHDDFQEGGVASLALHPDFADSGELFVSYVAPSEGSPANMELRVSRFSSAETTSGEKMDAASEELLVRLPQPTATRQGGHLAFGPDGFLYIALGDGGEEGDLSGRSQDPDSLFGKLLRIDVDGGAPFAIPEDNPQVEGSGRPEIFASGFRHPRRFSFDRETGDLWLGDIGDSHSEEINQVTAGGNYGWNLVEGETCQSGLCAEDLQPPVASYDHSEGESITGGFVYRGQELAELSGQYIFGDLVSGRLWALSGEDATGRERALLSSQDLQVAGFAQSQQGELFVLDWESQQILRMAPPLPASCGKSGPLDSPMPPAPPISTFQELYDQVISVNCAPCHTQRALGGLRMIDADTAFQNLIEVGAQTSACAGRTRVVPGNPEGSLLFNKVSGINLCGPRMPFQLPPIAEADIEAIRQWIASGAPR